MSENHHRYFFGSTPEMPWKKPRDLWALVAKTAVDGWEANERRYVDMDEYQRLLRAYPNNWVFEGVKHASEKSGAIQEDVRSGERGEDF
jgi:hypothetical protein